MSQTQLAKLWTVIGLALLYYGLNTWLVTQGGQEIFDAKLVLTSRVPAALMGLVICSILAILAALVATLYARRGGNAWHARIPVVGLGAIHTHSVEGKAYQAVMLLLFSLLPAVALVHFWLVLQSGRVLTTGTSARIAASIWDVTALRGLDDPARICSRIGDPRQCEGGATFLPALEPLALVMLLAVVAWANIRHWWFVFRGRKPKD